MLWEIQLGTRIFRWIVDCLLGFWVEGESLILRLGFLSQIILALVAVNSLNFSLYKFFANSSREKILYIGGGMSNTVGWFPSGQKEILGGIIFFLCVRWGVVWFIGTLLLIFAGRNMDMFFRKFSFPTRVF